MRFLFYDRVLELEIGKRMLARKAVALSEEYFPHHFPRRAVVPATLLIETMAQVAGWLNVITNEFAVATVLGLIEGVHIHEQANPGDVLDVEAWMMFVHVGGATLRGEIRRSGRPLATIDRMVFANGPVTDNAAIARERERFNYMSNGFKLEHASK